MLPSGRMLRIVVSRVADLLKQSLKHDQPLSKIVPITPVMRVANLNQQLDAACFQQLR